MTAKIKHTPLEAQFLAAKFFAHKAADNFICAFWSEQNRKHIACEAVDNLEYALNIARDALAEIEAEGKS
jgi:hypothetical protein